MTYAIYEHGLFASQGVEAATAFAALNSTDKSLLIQFLDSLGRIEFDSGSLVDQSVRAGLSGVGKVTETSATKAFGMVENVGIRHGLVLFERFRPNRRVSVPI